MTSARVAAATLLAASTDGRLEEICTRHRVRVLGVFGSAARPGPVEPGDVDIAVGFSERLGPVVALVNALTELVHCDDVDLAVLDGAEPLLRARAFRRRRSLRVRAGGMETEQMAALAEARDTAWLRELDLRALAEGRRHRPSSTARS